MSSLVLNVTITYLKSFPLAPCTLHDILSDLSNHVTTISSQLKCIESHVHVYSHVCKYVCIYVYSYTHMYV